jgi:hypothetical protein
MQPVLAILDGGACFFRFIGAPFGFFLRLAQLPLDLLSLRDVDEQPLTFGGQLDLLLPLQRDVAKRAEYAGQAAVRIAFGMGRDTPRKTRCPSLAMTRASPSTSAPAPARLNASWMSSAIVGMDQREPRAAL